MACPCCDHTMQGLCGDGEGRWFWCPACGTVKQGQQTDHYESPTFIRSPSMVAYLFADDPLRNIRDAIESELARRKSNERRSD